MSRLKSSCLTLAFALLLFGCVTAASNGSLDDHSVEVNPQSSKGPAPVASFRGEQGDVDRLVRLWKLRSEENINADYPVG